MLVGLGVFVGRGVAVRVGVFVLVGLTVAVFVGWTVIVLVGGWVGCAGAEHPTIKSTDTIAASRRIVHPAMSISIGAEVYTIWPKMQEASRVDWPLADVACAF